MTETAQEHVDDRRISMGWGRIVIVMFWVFGLVTVGMALWGLARQSDVPLGVRVIGVIAGIVYVLAAIGMTHNGRRMRMIAWGALVTAFVGPYIAGLSGLGLPASPEYFYSAWARFGVGYWYLPLILPPIGLVWMWISDPRRIVELAEGIERHSPFESKPRHRQKKAEE